MFTEDSPRGQRHSPNRRERRETAGGLGKWEALRKLREPRNHDLEANRPEPVPYEQFDGVGKKNRYTCTTCGASIVTIDRDSGVTAYSINCRIGGQACGWATMISAFYRNVNGEPTYEWRNPTEDEFSQLTPAGKDDVLNGVLRIYPIIQ